MELELNVNNCWNALNYWSVSDNLHKVVADNPMQISAYWIVEKCCKID